VLYGCRYRYVLAHTFFPIVDPDCCFTGIDQQKILSYSHHGHEHTLLKHHDHDRRACGLYQLCKFPSTFENLLCVFLSICRLSSLTCLYPYIPIRFDNHRTVLGSHTYSSNSATRSRRYRKFIEASALRNTKAGP